MTTQQVLFAETIAGMKKAFKRKAYDSDSDSEAANFTNRGKKLKRNARFAHNGQLAPAAGRGSYREPVDYAGVRRSIISRKQPLVDDDGYEVDSEDDAERYDEATSTAAELDPYANIRIENILAPLTASTDLPKHPTLSKPFISNTLTDLVSRSSGIMRKESHSLWQVRHLWTALCGDGTWVPCETMIGSNDSELYTDDHVARHLLSLSNAQAEGKHRPGNTNGDTNEDTGHTGEAREAAQPTDEEGDADVSMTDAEATSRSDKQMKKEAEATGEGENTGDSKMQLDDQSGEGNEGKEQHDKSRENADSLSTASKEAAAKRENGREQQNTETSVETQAGGRSRTDPPTNGDQQYAAGSEAGDDPFVHPLFALPAGAKPDRDLGLPETEAEDIRRLLSLYVQKQEEVCRGANRLHEGLLRAERLRKDVLHWSKAEAHCGPNRVLSDGEDWYDKEEWGLEDDLKKGQDEDDEEPTITTGKKTRARR